MTSSIIIAFDSIVSFVIPLVAALTYSEECLEFQGSPECTSRF
jgi:hypothetical protein